MNEGIENFIRMLDLWISVCCNYYSESIDYEQLEEVGINFN